MDSDETWQVGLRPEKTKPCTFPAKSRRVSERARKMGRRGVVFLSGQRRTTSATFLGSISAKLPTNTCPGGGSRHTISYSRKVEFPEKPSFYSTLGYPVCAQPTGHGKCSATPTLFPSPSGHPTDLSFLGDFCWGMYRFPPVRLRKSPYQQWAYLDGDIVAPPGEWCCFMLLEVFYCINEPALIIFVKIVIISDKWTEWMAEILFSFDVCLSSVSASVRCGPVNQSSLKRLKLRTSNSTCMFPRTVWTWPVKNFSKRGRGQGHVTP